MEITSDQIKLVINVLKDMNTTFAKMTEGEGQNQEWIENIRPELAKKYNVSEYVVESIHDRYYYNSDTPDWK